MITQTKCFSTIAGGKIDREKGIISGVSVIKEGVAKGHNLWIDSKSLASVLQVASEFSNGVKVKLKHRSDGVHPSVVDDVCGTLRHFSIDDKNVRADFHLFKSFAGREKIFEMAETIPDQFGFSIAFSGVAEEMGGKKFSRCQELQSIDLSDNPAANPDGLFSEKHKDDCDCDDCKKSKTKSMSSTAPTNEELALSIKTLTDLVTGLSTKISTPTPVTTLSYTDKDGKVVQLSAEQIQTALSTTNQLVADSKKTLDDTLKRSIITQMSSEGRVAINPSTKKAFTLVELNALPVESLQFAAVNSAVIPLEAKAVYRGGDPKHKTIDPALKGSDRIEAAYEKYNNLDTLLSTPMGQTVL